ncbi:hypothetical protein A2U01_0119246, partial [Trifolium medium]|nr:hypothetical protein [Trifolium medium]
HNDEPPVLKCLGRPDSLWWVTGPAKDATREWKPSKEPVSAR